MGQYRREPVQLEFNPDGTGLVVGYTEASLTFAAKTRRAFKAMMSYVS